MLHSAYLSLGSSQGNKSRNLQQALDKIAENCGIISKVSNVYETEPWGFEMEENFLNLAALVQTEMQPAELMKTLLEIEKQMGRKRPIETRYSSRSIDIDIIFYDDLILKLPGLTIPHPHAHERRFVLQPLTDINPEYMHPTLSKSVTQLLSECSDKGKIIKAQ